MNIASVFERCRDTAFSLYGQFPEGVRIGVVAATAIAAGVLGYTYLKERRELINELDRWCNEKRGTEEFEGRRIAKKRIISCYMWPFPGELDLSSLHLTSLPNCLDKLRRIRSVDLMRNDLSTLAGINFPPNVDTLKLGFNQITSLEGANFPPRLKILYLAHNQITTLAGAHFPSGLRELLLYRNQITSLVGVNFPSSLQNLDLATNQITIIGDSSSLLRLPVTGRVALHQNPLDSDTLESLRVESLEMRARTRAQRGPGIGYVVRAESPVSLEEALESWKSESSSSSQTDFSSLANLLKSENEKGKLSAFLQRVRRTAEYKKSKNKVSSEVQQMLSSAIQSECFREKMMTVIEDALSSCQDRVEISRKQIETLRRIYGQDRALSAKEICDLLIGTERSDLLDQHAREQIKKLRFRDDIETLLAYQIGLQEALNLPHTTQAMLYGGMSGVTPAMLEKAKEEVLSQSSSLDQKVNILLKYDAWIDWLKQHARADFDTMNEAFVNQLEKAENQAQIDQIQQEQKSAEKELIRKLTLNILQSQEPVMSSPSKEEAKE